MHYISNRIERVFDPASMKVTMYRSTIRMAYYDAISVGEVTVHNYENQEKICKQ